MLFEISNPDHQRLQNEYVHLHNIEIEDHDCRTELLVSVILDGSEYAEKQEMIDLELNFAGNQWLS